VISNNKDHPKRHHETPKRNSVGVNTMTIQKFSSGSLKNCLFFCVCRDFAGFDGLKVLKELKHTFVTVVQCELRECTKSTQGQ
jgi:hypothetical protein